MEQLQNRVVGKDSGEKYATNARELVSAALKVSAVPEDQWGAWLDAIEA